MNTKEGKRQFYIAIFIVIFLSFSFSFFPLKQAEAAVPNLLSFQGRL